MRCLDAQHIPPPGLAFSVDVVPYPAEIEYTANLEPSASAPHTQRHLSDTTTLQQASETKIEICPKMLRMLMFAAMKYNKFPECHASCLCTKTYWKSHAANGLELGNL